MRDDTAFLSIEILVYFDYLFLKLPFFFVKGFEQCVKPLNFFTVMLFSGFQKTLPVLFDYLSLYSD